MPLDVYLFGEVNSDYSFFALEHARRLSSSTKKVRHIDPGRPSYHCPGCLPVGDIQFVRDFLGPGIKPSQANVLQEIEDNINLTPKESSTSGWRLFEHDGVFSIKHVYGNPFDIKYLPDYFSDCNYSCATFTDIVLDEGDLVSHDSFPFISCKLYGFEDSALLDMIASAYHWLKNIAK